MHLKITEFVWGESDAIDTMQKPIKFICNFNFADI